MKHFIPFLALFACVMISCSTESHKSKEEFSELVRDLSIKGSFENGHIEFMDSSSMIKVTFENNHYSKLDLEKFGKEVAAKIYQFHDKAKEYDHIWINFKNKNGLKKVDVPIGLQAKIQIKSTEKNFVFTQEEISLSL